MMNGWQLLSIIINKRARDHSTKTHLFFSVSSSDLYIVISRNNANEEGAELIVTVLEAKELLGPADIATTEAMDTFVRIYLVPDEERAMQTKVRIICTKHFS